jgi:hypothetical protein
VTQQRPADPRRIGAQIEPAEGQQFVVGLVAEGRQVRGTAGGRQVRAHRRAHRSVVRPDLEFQHGRGPAEASALRGADAADPRPRDPAGPQRPGHRDAVLVGPQPDPDPHQCQGGQRERHHQHGRHQPVLQVVIEQPPGQGRQHQQQRQAGQPRGRPPGLLTPRRRREVIHSSYPQWG